MDNAVLVAILKSKIETTALIADRLAYSILKVRKLHLDSLTLERMSKLTDDDLEIIDAYLYRYGSLISNIQDSVFKSIGEIEHEPVSNMSNRDKTNLMERVGALPSSEFFSELAIIRNKLMHDYPEEIQKNVERINFIMTESPKLLIILVGIVKYAEKFGLFVLLDKFEHLTKIYVPVCERCRANPCACSKAQAPR